MKREQNTYSESSVPVYMRVHCVLLDTAVIPLSFFLTSEKCSLSLHPSHHKHFCSALTAFLFRPTLCLHSLSVFCKLIQEFCFVDTDMGYNDDADITDEHARLLQSGIILKPNTQKNMGTLANHLCVLIFAFALLTAFY